jgi:hypothetical protein
VEKIAAAKLSSFVLTDVVIGYLTTYMFSSRGSTGLGKSSFTPNSYRLLVERKWRI